MTKKFLIFVVILTSVTAIFAENEKVSCESDYGTCSLELSDEALITNCVCYDGRDFEFTDPVIEGFNDGPLTEKWCLATIDDYCKKIPAQCSNEPGYCEVDKNGNYKCHCYGIDGIKTGSGYFGEKGCNEILVETCGTETPTLRRTCQEEILNQCLLYFEKLTDNCYPPLGDIDEILDSPLYTSSSFTEIALQDCCYSENAKNEYKKQSDCLETYETCENQECCVCTLMKLGDSSSETGDTGDRGPADGATESGDTENSEAPADGAAAPAENKEDKKSDGCSMLFV
ncbi:hypothetical protein IKR20_08535 [bacterium]|nr:hypothetical protein [bacterium]